MDELTFSVGQDLLSHKLSFKILQKLRDLKSVSGMSGYYLGILF